MVFLVQLTNKEIAGILRELADLLEINGANRYRISAYHNASRNIMALNEDIKKITKENRLKEIKGIGDGIAAAIREIVNTGSCILLDEIKAELPDGLLEMINIPGLGPKRAHQLFYELGIQDIDGFKKALQSGEVRKLKGFGPKIEDKLIKSLQNYVNYQEVFILYRAIKQSHKLVNALKKYSGIKELEVTGSIRRCKELIRNVNLLAVSDNQQGVFDYFIELPEVREVISRDNKKINIITIDNFPVELQVVKQENFIPALVYFTGSPEHNSQLAEKALDLGYSLSEEGLYKGEKRINPTTENELYQLLNLDFIIPELREGRGELEAAAEGRLPQCITYKDIKGDLHIHSRYSDGAYSITDIVEAARGRGYHYIAITDHSQSLRVAHGMTPERLLQQQKEIDILQQQYDDIIILKGIEVDINNDGTLDYSDEILSSLDIVIASVHTGFNQPAEKMTERIIRAMENPLVNIVGHLHGRILKRRKGYDLDLERILKAARDTNTCLEINSSPYRLDLDDLSVKQAREYKVKVVINTDSHHLAELDDMYLGVTVARRGWLERGDVLNTMDINDLKGFLRRK